MTDNSGHPLPTKPPTLSMLYLPGGAALVLITAVMLARIEELSGLPTRVLYPTATTGSGGSVLAGLLYGPEPITAKEAIGEYYKGIQSFVPVRPGRVAKMLTANMIHTGRRMIMNPADAFRIKDIANLAHDMKQMSGPDTYETIQRLETLAVRRWPKASDPYTAKRYIEALRRDNPKLVSPTNDILAHIVARTKNRTGPRTIFNRVALAGGSFITRRWANDYLIDASIQDEAYNAYFKRKPLSAMHGSVFMFTFDTLKSEAVHYGVVKKDLLDPDCMENEDIFLEDPPMSDAIQSSTAHPAYRMAHKTENGRLNIDLAITHGFDRDVTLVQKILRKQYPQAHMNVLVLHTGGDVFDIASLEEEQRQQAELGIPGGMIDGTMLARISASVTSAGINAIRQNFKYDYSLTDAVQVIEPRLISRSRDEYFDFPSINSFDTSTKNLDEIVRRGVGVTIELDQQLRAAAQRAVDNRYSAGYLSEEDYLARSKRIAEAPLPVQDRPAKARPDYVSVVTAQDEQRMHRRVVRYIGGLSDKFTHMSKGEANGLPPAANDDVMPRDRQENPPANQNTPALPPPKPKQSTKEPG